MLNGLDLFSENIMRGWPNRKRSDHPCWKGGTRVDRDGYIQTWAPDHPWPRRGYLREHIRVMEISLGRRLQSNECVHHLDGNRQNNALSNLEVMERGEHIRHHRALDKHHQKKDEKGRFVSCGSI